MPCLLHWHFTADTVSLPNITSSIHFLEGALYPEEGMSKQVILGVFSLGTAVNTAVRLGILAVIIARQAQPQEKHANITVMVCFKKHNPLGESVPGDGL